MYYIIFLHIVIIGGLLWQECKQNTDVEERVNKSENTTEHLHSHGSGS